MKIFSIILMVDLTNRMWGSVVCTLIDNDMHHHRGENVVESRGATVVVTMSHEAHFFKMLTM